MQILDYSIAIQSALQQQIREESSSGFRKAPRTTPSRRVAAAPEKIIEIGFYQVVG